MWLTRSRKINLRQAIIWTALVLLTIIFQLIYYDNSHGVYSDFITYLWIVPTIVAAGYLVLMLIGVDIGAWTRYAFNLGSGVLIIYLILKGVYAIALTSNSWVVVFLIISIVAYVAFIPLLIIEIATQKKNVPTN